MKMRKKSIHEKSDNISDFAELLQYRAIHQPDQTAYIFLKDGETTDLIYLIFISDSR